MSIEQILAVLRPIEGTLGEGMVAGYDEFMGLPVESRAKLSAGARAFCVHDFQCDHLEKLFAGDERVRLVEHEQLRYLQVSGEKVSVGLRPKKLTDSLRTCNIQTKQQQMLLEQGILGDWAEPDVVHVILGYRLDHDALEPSVEGVYVLQENVDGLLWSHRLPLAEGLASSTLVRLPTAPAEVKVSVKQDVAAKRNARKGG